MFFVFFLPSPLRQNILIIQSAACQNETLLGLLKKAASFLRVL